MRPENDATDEHSVFLKELKLLRERVEFLEASVFGGKQNPALNNEQLEVRDAHITVQSQQGAIAIAIRSPSKASTSSSASTLSQASVCTSRSDAAPSSSQPAIFGNPSPSPTEIPTAPGGPSPTPIPFVPSQTTSFCQWGVMMTPDEVQELLAPEPQIGEYYVVTKGRRPGVYLFWPDAHELVEGLRSPCYWKKIDKHAALGQYTIAYKKGTCEYRFQ